MEENKKNCDLHEEDCDCCEAEEIVELEGDDGKKYKFYFIGIFLVGTEKLWYDSFIPQFIPF